MMKASLIVCAGSLVNAADIVITTGTQTGFFRQGFDVASLNPHDYRPNEFVTNDFIYEGLTAWDGTHTAGVDGVAGTDDDFVKPSLASAWTTNYAAVAAGTATTGCTSPPCYEVTFTLREGVTFHDGSAWDANACQLNFNQIMGGTGVMGAPKAMRGMHDWMGFTQALDSWTSPTAMSFKLTFNGYYEAVLRELSFIRPFRMISIASLPSFADFELSHNAWRGGNPRSFRDYSVGPANYTAGPNYNPVFIMRGVSNPIGTGPYQVVDKVLQLGNTVTRRLPAAEFNASCYTNDACTYTDANGAPTGEFVKEVLFTKFAAHRSASSTMYDNVIFRAYASVSDVKLGLQNGTLDVAYGVNTLAPSSFISLATAESGANVVAHQASTDINTRLLLLNSGGRIDSVDKRKFVMGILAAGRQALYDGELAEEMPMDTLFDPAAPHCSVLSTLSTPAQLAATGSGVTAASFTQPLRFLYIRDIPHQQIIAAKVIADLYTAGIAVTPMPVDKDTYNARHCDYLGDPNGGFPYYYSYPYGDATDNYHTWDIAYSETWGPPYDATSKLWDMTHGIASGWCSAEADAVAVSGMGSVAGTMTNQQFVTNVRALSSTIDPVAREASYAAILTALHNEAIFLPITAKRQTAVTNTRVSGFQFGFMEYDLPLANLHPATPAATVTTSFAAAGDVSDYGPSVQASMKEVFGAEAGVSPNAVTLTIASGSVVITAEIAVESAAQASTISSTLNSGVMASPTALQSAMAAQGVTVSVASVSAPVANVPAVASSSDSEDNTAIVIVVAVVAALLLLCVVVMAMKEQQGKPIFTKMGEGVHTQTKSASA